MIEKTDPVEKKLAFLGGPSLPVPLREGGRKALPLPGLRGEPRRATMRPRERAKSVSYNV